MPDLRIRGKRKYTEDAPNCLDAGQVDAVLHAITPYWSCVVHVLALTGQRWGEVSGLLWPDIDLEAKTARIERTNWKGTLQPRPKTAAGRRTIALSEPLPELLEAHRRAQLAAQHPGLELGLVFPTAKGTPHKGTPLNVVLREACKSLGFPRLSPHGLRRTYNNLLRQVAEGAVVRSIVGHTTEAMTEHYSVISLNEKRAAAGKVLELVRGKDNEK
jgi:integrase